MERILIAATSEKAGATLSRFLAECGARGQPSLVCSGADARRRMAEGDFDLIFISAPLSDEFGADLSQFAATQSGAGVLLLVKAEIADEVAEKVGESGVLVLSKPLGRAALSQGLQLARAVHQRILALVQENRRLQTRMEDLRLISRAKCVLIECCGMTEPEAHSFIEKKAMDTRQSKREVARALLDQPPKV